MSPLRRQDHELSLRQARHITRMTEATKSESATHSVPPTFPRSSRIRAGKTESTHPSEKAGGANELKSRFLGVHFVHGITRARSSYSNSRYSGIRRTTGIRDEDSIAYLRRRAVLNRCVLRTSSTREREIGSKCHQRLLVGAPQSSVAAINWPSGNKQLE